MSWSGLFNVLSWIVFLLGSFDTLMNLVNADTIMLQIGYYVIWILYVLIAIFLQVASLRLEVKK